MSEYYVRTKDGTEYFGEEYSQAVSRARITCSPTDMIDNGDWYRSADYGRRWSYMGSESEFNKGDV